MRLGEHENIKPIKELLQAVEAEKSVDLDTVVAAKRQQTASAKSRGVRKTERVYSRPWEVGFVARLG